MATHKTSYTYKTRTFAGVKILTSCMIEHSIRHAGGNLNPTDKASTHHQALYESVMPKRPGNWVLKESGGSGGASFDDHRGFQSTYWAEWENIGESCGPDDLSDETQAAGVAICEAIGA